MRGRGSAGSASGATRSPTAGSPGARAWSATPASASPASAAAASSRPAEPTRSRARREDNRRAVDEAAALGTDVLVLVCGPPVDRDLEGARELVAEGIADLAPYAAAAGVKLGIEPLHPMFAGDRSVIVTMAQATTLAERFPADRVGVIVDAYHVWWDPDLRAQLSRAAGRILGYHVSDWLVPPPTCCWAEA